MDNNIQNYRNYQGILLDDIVPSSVHFLKLDDNGNPHPYGSGVLVEIDGYHFVFTAAHVIEKDHTSIGIGLNGNIFLTLGGVIHFNQTEDRAKDKLDIGIILLNEETVGRLKILYRFIKKEELGINHVPVSNPQYIAVGYPATKSKFNQYKNSLKSVPFNYITMPAKAEKYKPMKCDPTLQMLVHYDKNSVIDYQAGIKRPGPDSYGMSGCGFWHIPISGFIQNSREKRLVSILTDWPNKNFWIGTKIDLFTELVRKNYNLDLPVSDLVNVHLDKS